MEPKRPAAWRRGKRREYASCTCCLPAFPHGTQAGGRGSSGVEAALQHVGPLVTRVATDVSSVVTSRLRHHLNSAVARGDTAEAHPDRIASTAGGIVNQVHGWEVHRRQAPLCASRQAELAA